MLRIVLLVIILVLAPTAAFFLWAWAAKIKQERQIAGQDRRCSGSIGRVQRLDGVAPALIAVRTVTQQPEIRKERIDVVTVSHWSR